MDVHCCDRVTLRNKTRVKFFSGGTAAPVGDLRAAVKGDTVGDALSELTNHRCGEIC